jgi:glycosyltransferase involved in cell wall biosynthesis
MMAYQHEKYVRHALDALVAQTCQAFKLIAIDDGSTDDTYLILKEFESGDLRGKMTVLTHPDHKNCGIYAGYRRCLENLDTEFFMPHGSDDLLKPEAIGYLLGLMDRNPSADFAYGPCEVIDSDGRSKEFNEGTEDIGYGLETLQTLLYTNSVREPSMFFKAKCSRVIREDHSNIVYGDWLHNMILFTAYKPIRYSEPVSLYRIHLGNVTKGANASRVHGQRYAELLCAALTDPFLSSDNARRALVLLSGNSSSLAINAWPSTYQIAKELLAIPGKDVAAIVRCLNHKPSQRYTSLITLILVLRAPLGDIFPLSRSHLLPSFSLLIPSSIKSFKARTRSAIKMIWHA